LQADRDPVAPAIRCTHHPTVVEPGAHEALSRRPPRNVRARNAVAPISVKSGGGQ